MSMSGKVHVRLSLIYVSVLSLHDLIDLEHRVGQLCEITSSDYKHFSILNSDLNRLEIVREVSLSLDRL